jgi:hypothetical protein
MIGLIRLLSIREERKAAQGLGILWNASSQAIYIRTQWRWRRNTFGYGVNDGSVRNRSCGCLPIATARIGNLGKILSPHFDESGCKQTQKSVQTRRRPLNWKEKAVCKLSAYCVAQCSISSFFWIRASVRMKGKKEQHASAHRTYLSLMHFIWKKGWQTSANENRLVKWLYHTRGNSPWYSA